ncbi:MAG TPA: leucine--tRNA ligase [Pirellulales bacterium]|jgi:leucyl-tRNA synthetase|nr:leucine--tRNA ligase [Pirellulales bacterium]
MPRYNPAEIEPKWQNFWEENRTFAAPRLPPAKKLYALDMFPYPSGDGLHVGHPEGYTATDIVCRFERMRGKSVLHPMGFDAFGLPAEEHAIATGTPPRVGTERNIATFRRQLKMLGFSYDWDREVATTDRGYFHWTQWIFLVLFDTWFDAQQQRGRPISELPIPHEVVSQGGVAVRRFQDEQRLAFQTEAPVNWCPALGTVLANEEVQGGVSERGGHPVVRIPLRQWMLRITAYADRLDRDLEGLDWPESVKALQRNWIGRSTGAEVDFYIGPPKQFAAWQTDRAQSGFPNKPGPDVLRIYTTRPDTLFGATYMVIAPEHPFIKKLTTAERAAAVQSYCDRAATKSDLDRTELAKDKSGEFTGSYAINPINGEPVPVWVADYVLISYGTGAIMAVPAHDERDFEFAQKFKLPVREVVSPPPGTASTEPCFSGDGVAIHSGPYDGLPTAEFKQRIAADLTQQGVGRGAVNYKLRDWLFSRQRFWGEPFPILHELDEHDQPTGLLRIVPAESLPVDLPELADYKPVGEPVPPLEKSPREWLYPVIDGRRYKRETNTMPQWAGSCWYFLRFIDPKNERQFVDPALEKAWMPVDLYIGGAEHAVLHLLYSRFWHKVLFDRGHVSTDEPFQKLVNQGMILGDLEYTAYQDELRNWVSAAEVRFNDENKPVHRGTQALLSSVKLPPDEVEKLGDGFVIKVHPAIKVDGRAHKMSKSRGNVVNPEHVVQEYGADSLRLYEMFMGPLEATKPWSTTGVNGVRGFLDRVWRMIVNDRAENFELNAAVQECEPTLEQNRWLHKTIHAVTRDLERLEFNTAIAKMMEFTNFFTKADQRPKSVMERFVLLLAPFAPHLAEELWHMLGHEQTLAYAAWPVADPALLVEETTEIPVQVNGKLRSRVSVRTGAAAADLEAAARADEKVAEQLAGKTIVKVIAVAGKMVNFVVK